jgi:hypothetical protein
MPTRRSRRKPRRKRKTHEELMREYVATLSADAVRDLLLEAAGHDMTLRIRKRRQLATLANPRRLTLRRPPTEGWELAGRKQAACPQEPQLRQAY